MDIDEQVNDSPDMGSSADSGLMGRKVIHSLNQLMLSLMTDFSVSFNPSASSGECHPRVW